MAATPKSAPAQPQAGVPPAPAAASGRGLGRAASLTSLSSAAAASAELQQPAPQRLIPPAMPWRQPRFPRSHRASHYGPSQVVPAPSEESQHPDGRRPPPAAQQRQQSAQASPSLARSILAWVAVLGTRRCRAEQQQQQSTAGSAAGQEELEAASLGTSTCAVPFQPQAQVPERSGSPTDTASRGMAAASDCKGGAGMGSVTLMRRGSR